MTEAPHSGDPQPSAAATAPPQQPQKRRFGSIVLVVVGLLCGYFAVGFLGLPFLVTVFIAFHLGSNRRWIALAILVLLSPPSVAFITGVVTYTQGTATLWFMGLPGTESHIIDPETRCGLTSGGDLIGGGESLVIIPNNAAVQMMTSVFGLMKGAYDGPYPTKEEALAALNGAEPIPLEDLLKDALKIGGQEIRLDSNVGRDLALGTSMFMLVDEITAGKPVQDRTRKLYGQITAAIWRERVLILRIPAKFADEPSAMIVALDCNAGRPFAYFGQGNYFHSIPPVIWQKTRGSASEPL